MKKVICFVLIGCSFLGFSQIREKGTIEITPIVGFSQANYLSNQYLGEPINSVHLGAYGDYFLNNRWSIRSGLLYQKMGSGGTIFNSDYKEKLDYLTIPVNINWHFGSTRKWYLNFGTSVGILTSAKADAYQSSYDPTDYGFNMPQDLKDYVKPLQLSFSFGIGYKIQVNDKFSIMLDHYESVSLIEVNKREDGGDNDIVNVFGSFNVGAVFKL
ncbi:porin family protein [Flavobacterium sp.]|uniref:porin family protein n=1 Tax=Flavobacterium sp. TaxID=239 RepID=UPI0028BF2047|nr:porin family protein [Flavobacterium sp.]